MRDGHGRAVAHRLAGAVGVGLVVVALGSCSSPGASSGAGAADSAMVASTADCRAPQVLAALGMLEGSDASTAGVTSSVPHPDAPSAGPVPAGFVPQAVVVCARGGALRDAQGTWSSVTATRREGDLRPLLAALRGASPSSAPGCRPGLSAVQLWFVDVLGEAIRATTPGTCGVPTQAVRTALQQLSVTSSDDYPVRLVVAAPTAAP